MADKNMKAKINVEFTEATSRQSIESGDSINTVFGKIKKFFSDLKSVAFSGSYNDLSNKPTIPTELKSPYSLIIQGNGTTLTNGTYDGSAAKTVNITPSSIGAATTSHTHSAYVNQNAFSNVTVGSTTVSADSATDTLTLVAGSNVTITPDATNDKITIAATDTKYSKLSQFTNDSGYITGITKDMVTTALGYTPPTSNTNTTYSLSKSGSTITLTGSDGNTTSVTDSDTNTTYSAGTGLSLSGTTFNHKNSVTAGTAQGDANKTLSFGGTFTIPTVTYDAQGHVTGKGTTTMTMPANPNTDTKNTAGSTDTSSKIFLVGATSQAANPQTYSDNQVYATNGQLNGNSMRVAEKVIMQYNSSTESLDFVFE